MLTNWNSNFLKKKKVLKILPSIGTWHQVTVGDNLFYLRIL